MPADAIAADAVLLDFSSAYCSPCRALQPIIAQLEHSGVPVRHVDVQAEPQFASRFGVRQTPTLVVLSAGKEVTRLVGMHTAAEIREALAINPSGPADPDNRRNPHRVRGTASQVHAQPATRGRRSDAQHRAKRARSNAPKRQRYDCEFMTDTATGRAPERSLIRKAKRPWC